MKDQPAGDRAPRTAMYRNGSVYSPADPFATAVLVQDGRIAWVGQEAGADSLTDERVETVDLDGLLVAPGFAGILGSEPDEQGRRSLLAAGYTGVVVRDDAGASYRGLAEGEAAVAAPAGLTWAGSGEPGPGAALMVEAQRGGDGAWIDVVREALRDGIPVGLARALDAAAPENPWLVAQEALRLETEEAGVPARASVTAQTRGVLRAFAAGGPLGGQIVPDAPARFVAWRAESLMVQTADSRIAAWSTDPRARTPLLPELGTGATPRAELTVLGASDLPAR
jgi:predicted amidohydrolase YtcJ